MAVTVCLLGDRKTAYNNRKGPECEDCLMLEGFPGANVLHEEIPFGLEPTPTANAEHTRGKRRGREADFSAALLTKA
jgi:hypothetical protein